MSALLQLILGNFLTSIGGGGGGGSTDSSFANVTLLVHADGTNGSTTFIDSSSINATLTASGTAQISNTQSKFGGTSLNPGTAHVSVTTGLSNFAFGSSAFTIEMWVYPTNFPGGMGLIASRTDGMVYDAFDFSIIGDSLRVIKKNTDDSWEFVTAFTDAALSANVWSHIAIVGDGTTLKYYLNGVAASNTITYSIPWQTPSAAVYIGYSGSGVFQGYIDEVRITKGVARYTANFTPPAAAFPNS